MSRRLATALLGLASALLSLAAFEVAGSLLLRRALGGDHVVDVDHRLKPSRRRGINSDGIRSAREADSFLASSYNIVFLGDSYTFGVYVQPEQAFPAVVEHLLNEDARLGPVQVANFGWASSSPLLSLRLLRDIGARYRPRLVVLCLDMTDFHDDLRYRRMLEKSEARLSPTRFLLRRTGVDERVLGALAALGFPLGGGLPRDRFFVVNQPLDQSRPWLAETDAHILETERQAKALGAEFLLALLPRPFQYNAAESPDNWERDAYDAGGEHVLAPFAWFEELAARVDFPAVSLLEPFRASGVYPTAFRHDPHWNAAGHEVAGRALARSILEQTREGRLREPQ